MNQSILSGNLTADIETREVGEHHLSKFTLACNEGDRVLFMPVEAWNMPHLAEHLFKGSKALVAGGLKQDNWETDAGEKRSRIVLHAHKVDFIGFPKEPEGKGRNAGTGSPRQGNGRRQFPGRKGHAAGAR